MQDMILAYGPPPLTQQAADAALDTIDFIAAAVRGFDAIDVTNVLRPIWRAHLAYYYPSLPFEMRVWYAETPTQLAAINANWPILNPMQRGMILQQWAAELPAMLWMLDPVLAEAQNLELQEHVRANIAASRQQAAPTYNSSQAAMNQIDTRATQATRLASFNVNMTANTINQMRAMNNH
jgi:hypothetical protein